MISSDSADAEKLSCEDLFRRIEQHDVWHTRRTSANFSLVGTGKMRMRWPLLLGVVLWPTCVFADLSVPQAPVTASTLAERAARRFPQPVRVGDLIDRQVLQPVPAQHVLGRVAAINRNKEGGIDVVVRFGGFLGFGTRPIAVPVEAVALLGEHVVVMDFTPEQLRAFPTVQKGKEMAIAPGEIIRVGLTKPFH